MSDIQEIGLGELPELKSLIGAIFLANANGGDYHFPASLLVLNENNLSDLDEVKARANLDVLSSSEINLLLKNALSFYVTNQSLSSLINDYYDKGDIDNKLKPLASTDYVSKAITSNNANYLTANQVNLLINDLTNSQDQNNLLMSSVIAQMAVTINMLEKKVATLSK